MKLNLGCGLAQKPKDEGWVNVDRLALPGVDEAVDLFSFPWPFATSSCEEMYAGHIVEHVPHEAREAAGWRGLPLRWRLTGDQEAAFRRWVNGLLSLDGFFAFFAEVWRVLVPGGKIHVVGPYGMSHGAMQDPTHTRFLLPQTFQYLCRQEAVTFDYGLPFEFKMLDGGMTFVGECAPLVDWATNKMGEGNEKNALLARVGWLVDHSWNMAQTLTVVLEAVKDAQQRHPCLAAPGDAQPLPEGRF